MLLPTYADGSLKQFAAPFANIAYKFESYAVDGECLLSCAANQAAGSSPASTVHPHLAGAGVPQRLEQQLPGAVSDVPTGVYCAPAALCSVRLSVPTPHVAPMLPYAPSAAHIASVLEAQREESMSITAHLEAAPSLLHPLRHGRSQPLGSRGADTRAQAQSQSQDSMSFRDMLLQHTMAAGSAAEAEAVLGDAPELRSDAMLRQADTSPSGSGSGSGADAVAAYPAGPVPREQVYAPHETQYTLTDAMRCKAHYAQVHAQAKAAASAASAAAAAASGEAAAKGGSGRSTAARLRAGFQPETVALVSSLTAIRYGLQELEHHRRRRNAVLNRDPAGVTCLRRERGLPPGRDSPYPNM